MSGSGWRWSSSSAFRWIDVSFSLPTSFFRWPRLFASYITPNWSPRASNLSLSGLTPRWDPRNLREWLLDLDFSIVDNVLWSLVTAFESVALVSFLCFFFVFCGCTV